jgi:CheY-like chemotaxis protein
MPATTDEPRVLIADDSAVVRQVLSFTCRQLPQLVWADIDEAKDGAVALEHVKARKYDLVLADIRMPHIDGIELVRRVRQELADATTPIVLISTLGSDEDIRRGMAAGATAYVPKPLEPDRIRQVLEKLLA